MSEDRDYIDLCKKLICERLDWEQGSIRQRDFEYLNHEIFKLSKVNLSTTTLRRIWSNQYKNTPQSGTLNALAEFIGFESWNHFKQNYSPSPQKEESLKPKRTPNKKVLILLSTLVLLTLLAGVFITASSKNSESLDLSSLFFESDKDLYKGVPATAGFKYNISGIDADVFIELSWNPYERALLDPAKNFYTGVYFYPDYHYSKLIVNNRVIAYQPVHVVTDDWHGSLMRSDFEKRPIHLEDSEFKKTNGLEVSSTILSKYGFGKSDTLYTELVYSNPSLDTISVDGLILETKFRGIDYGSTRACQRLLLFLKGEKGYAMIPITEKGCYGELNLAYAEKQITGKFDDLSGLEVDFYQWQELRLEVSEKQVRLKVGQNDPFTFDYSNEVGKLKAVKYHFTGLGAIDHLNIWDKQGQLLLFSTLGDTDMSKNQ